jgi:hypothetical protein
LTLKCAWMGQPAFNGTTEACQSFVDATDLAQG